LLSSVNDRRNALHAQVERWGSEAKRLADAGREVAALDLYRKASDAVPGAPWLQLRTAELARKLRQNDLAISYFRRSAAAFISAGFQKRAIAPLRAAWTTAKEGVPRSAAAFVEISMELSQLQKQLGLPSDAAVTIEYANDALRRANLKEMLELEDAPRESGIPVHPSAVPLPPGRASSG